MGVLAGRTVTGRSEQVRPRSKKVTGAGDRDKSGWNQGPGEQMRTTD